MQSRINSEKAEALLKWVNTVNKNSQINSLQELSNAKLLMEIICLNDKDYQVEGLNSLDNKWLGKVIAYLENFYHQPLADFVDQNKITESHNVLEIGKVLSLLLCCAVQGENVSECIDKITSLDENLQFQLKVIIEAVLKDLDGGKIDSVNIAAVLCQSESFRDVQGTSEEYHSSPIIMSPVSLYNSPIKALMASPQMQSRQSQVTISKLYKRLNQFQIKINNLQRTQSDLEHEIEEKRKQIEEQELKIQYLSKEVAKVPALEEEVESLSRFETELDDVNRRCDSLRKSTKELEKYKIQFLKLEKDYSDILAEKQSEKLCFEKYLNEVKNNAKEELQCVQSLLDDSRKTCEQLRSKLQDASTAEETTKNQLCEQQSFCVQEIEKLKKALADSNASRDKLCLKNDQDVLRQIAREADLKQCFRDREAALQSSVDQVQLQNCELKRNMEQLQISLNKEVKTNTDLESSLTLSESKLTEVICKYERLQSDFISLGDESKKTISKIQAEKDCLDETIKKTQADRDMEIVLLKKTNENLQEQSRSLISELDGTKQKLLETLKDQNAMQTTLNDVCKEKKLLFEKNASIKKNLKEYVAFASELFTADNDVLKENSSLEDDFKELEFLKRNVETLQSSLRLAHEEKMSAMKDSVAMKEQIRELEPLAKECTILQDRMTSVNEKLQTLKEENIKLEKQAQEMISLSEEMSDLRNALRISNEEKQSLQEINSSLNDELTKRKVDSGENEVLKNRFECMNKETLFLKKENADMIKQTEFLSGQCVSLRQLLDVISKDKLALEESNSSLKDAIAKRENLSEEHKVLQRDFNVLNEEKLLLDKENTDLKQKMKCTEHQSVECVGQHQLLNESSKAKVSITEENALFSEKAQNQVIPPMKDNDNGGIIETKLRELLMSKVDEIMQKFKIPCEQDKNISVVQENDIVNIEADLAQCYTMIADQYTKHEQKINDSLGVEPRIKKQQKPSLDEIISNEEVNVQIQELQSKICLLQKENEDLIEFQKKSKEEILTEREKVESLEKSLKASEAAMEKLNENNVELELGMLSVQDQIKQLQDEKIEMKDYIPQVEAKVVDLDKKLSEEEFITKRLAVEVRSLEAQLAHADRQLRNKLETEDNQTVPRINYVNLSGQNVRRMSLVAEETSSVTEESVDITEDSSVADDSIISESMSENKDVSVCSNQKDVKGTSKLKNQEHVDKENILCQQEEILKKLRRRSAVYSQKSSQKSEINNKRRSTIGTESFVVGQFSNTVADEPDEHDYEWDRILELKERNSICARHLRSSYPVETQAHLKEEVEEEELKSGRYTTTKPRKRLRDNVSESNISTSFNTTRSLPRSKSENAFGKLNPRVSNNENERLISSSSFPDQENRENIEQYNRRESIAFNVDITPAKKSRISNLRPRMPRPFGLEKKETVKNKSKIKPAQQTSKKFTLQRKPNSVKDGKRPQRTRRTNLAV